jgi:hypothetical protein
VIDPAAIPVSPIDWPDAVRIIRSLYPPIDLFEDIADPADWSLLLSAEQKTNPRLAETIGHLDLVPPSRRIGGPGATILMAPFTHVSPDRPSRFTDGRHGVLYAGDRFEVALFETIHHHARFMARTGEEPGWTSQFREILMHVRARLHDLREVERFADILDPGSHGAGQELGRALRRESSDGVVYPSCRWKEGFCVGLFQPDLASNVRQARHLDYHWNGNRVDFVRVPGAGEVFAVAR